MNERGLSGFLTGPGLAVLAIAGMLVGITPAFATYNNGPCPHEGGDGACDITTVVTQVPATGITFSNGTQTNNVKYTVKLTHYNTRVEAFSKVFFVGDTSVLASDAGSTAKILSYGAPVVTGASQPTTTCSISSDTHILCTFDFTSSGGFSAKLATITFDVLVQAPDVGTNSNGGTLKLTSETSWLEPNGSTAYEQPRPLVTSTTLKVPDPKVVETFLPAPGTVTTGTAGGAATCTQPWVTIAKVPAAASVGVSLIPDDIFTPAPDRFTKLAIPGQQFGVGTHWYDPDAASKLLVITLRRDNCTIDGRGPLTDALRILKEPVYYQSDASPANPNPQYNQLYLCAVTSGPFPGQPCIASLKVYTRWNSPSSEYWGDHQWVIYANENGKYRN